MTLERRQIGRTGIEVTTLGFGGGPIGAVGDLVSDAETEKIVRAALDGGIRYFETAPLYGHGLSEKRLGRVIRSRSRDRFVLSTKVGRLLVPEGDRSAGMRDQEPFGIRYD